MVSFTSAIYKIGINPVVDPPEKALSAIFHQAGKTRGPIPVRGRLNGADFIQTLVKYKGAWRLYINGPMLKDSGLAVGDVANIEMEFDPRPRDVPVPPALASFLAKDKGARLEFEKLSPSRRKDILKYLGSLKTEASVVKNVERVMRHLRGEETDAQHALMGRKKSLE